MARSARPARVATPERVSRDTRLFAALLVAAVVVSQLSLPVRLAALVFAVWAAVVGVRTLGMAAALSRAGRPQRSQLGLSVGLGVVVIITVNLVAQAAFLPAGLEHERCLAGAGTSAARALCEDAYRDRLGRLTGGLLPGG